MEHDVAHQEDRNDATELLIIISKLRTNKAIENNSVVYLHQSMKYKLANQEYQNAVNE